MSIDEADAIRQALSAPRMSTYERAVAYSSPEALTPLDLYLWNAQISGAFLPALHVCEVILRNAVAGALERIYGSDWPRERVFIESLPAPRSGYKPREDLNHAARKYPLTSKVIPELKFVFWQRLLTSKHDERIWSVCFDDAFPHMPRDSPLSRRREELYNQIDHVRDLRNRIAHHEPIFRRDLALDYQRIRTIVSWRCPVTAAWVNRHQTVLQLLESDPRRR